MRFLSQIIATCIYFFVHNALPQTALYTPCVCKYIVCKFPVAMSCALYLFGVYGECCDSAPFSIWWSVTFFYVFTFVEWLFSLKTYRVSIVPNHDYWYFFTTFLVHTICFTRCLYLSVLWWFLFLVLFSGQNTVRRNVKVAILTLLTNWLN